VGPNSQIRPQPIYQAWRHARSSCDLLTRSGHVRDLIGSHDPGLAYSPSLPCPRDHHRSKERLQSEAERERAVAATTDSRSDRCFGLSLRSGILAGVYRLDLELPRATGVTGRHRISHRNITSAMAPHLAVPGDSAPQSSMSMHPPCSRGRPHHFALVEPRNGARDHRSVGFAGETLTARAAPPSVTVGVRKMVSRHQMGFDGGD
jgi:hypothetical protein